MTGAVPLVLPLISANDLLSLLEREVVVWRDNGIEFVLGTVVG